MPAALISDEQYPTPPPRVWARLAELPLAAVGWTLDRLLGLGAIRRALRGRAANRSLAASSRGVRS
jgi:hypothetical protein